jgi:hypothetical protein
MTTLRRWPSDRLLKEQKEARHAARQQNIFIVISFVFAFRRGVKRTASSRESAAQNSSSPCSSSLISPRKIKFVRKEGYDYRFECDLYDYGTDCTDAMKKHEEMHAGVRYHCPKCTHASTVTSNLQTHISTVHEELKEFECPLCHKGFGHASTVKTNRESVHEGVRHVPRG